MHRIAAELRHRELTQEVYDIGDEVATSLDHLIEAITDYDAELVEDCVSEFLEITEDARNDSRTVTAELMGLRQALTNGLRAGRMSARHADDTAKRPELLDAARLTAEHPVPAAPVAVAEQTWAVQARTTAVIEQLEALVSWVLSATDTAANDIDALSLPLVFNRLSTDTTAVIDGWMDAVVEEFPAYVRSQRGHHPPPFLAERARIDAVVAKVAAKRRAEKSGAAV